MPIIPDSKCDCCERRRKLEYHWKIVTTNNDNVKNKKRWNVGIDCHSKMFVLAEMYNHLRSIALPSGDASHRRRGESRGYRMFGLDPEIAYGSTDDDDIRKGFKIFQEMMVNRASAICNVRVKYKKGWKNSNKNKKGKKGKKD